MYTCCIQSFKILASFYSWAGWFEYCMVENPRKHVLAWFSSVMSKTYMILHARMFSVCPSWIWAATWQNKLNESAPSEDSDQSGRMSRLIWVFAGRTVTLLVWSCRGSIIWNICCFYFPQWILLLRPESSLKCQRIQTTFDVRMNK